MDNQWIINGWSMDNLWIWLVVSTLPLWKRLEWKSIGMMTFPTEWGKKNVHNHQPDDVTLKNEGFTCKNWWNSSEDHPRIRSNRSPNKNVKELGPYHHKKWHQLFHISPAKCGYHLKPKHVLVMFRNSKTGHWPVPDTIYFIRLQLLHASEPTPSLVSMIFYGFIWSPLVQ